MPSNPPGPRRDEIGPAQRALWVFLISTLVAPAVAAVAIFVASIVAGAFGFGPPSLQRLAAGALASVAAERAISAYVWAAVPSALAGGALAVLVMARGTFGWLAGAVAAVAAFAASAIVAGGQLTNHLTMLSLLAALIAVVMRWLLVRARLIND